MPPPLKNWVLTPHASAELARRGISELTLRAVLDEPEQRFPVRDGREVLQRRVVMDEVTYVVRVFVDTDRNPAEVVTVYRSSKVGKYWSSRS